MTFWDMAAEMPWFFIPIVISLSFAVYPLMTLIAELIGDKIFDDKYNDRPKRLKLKHYLIAIAVLCCIPFALNLLEPDTTKWQSVFDGRVSYVSAAYDTVKVCKYDQCRTFRTISQTMKNKLNEEMIIDFSYDPDTLIIKRIINVRNDKLIERF